jgi:uncharacterized protein DUF4242
MARYLIQRNFGERDEGEMDEIGRDSKRIIAEHTPEIVWEISHVVADEDGNITTFCIYQAPNEAMILQHASLLGRHRIDNLYEIGGQVSPADFPG